MTTPIKLVAVLAATLVIAVVGYALLPGSLGPGSSMAAPTPTTQPSAAATQAAGCTGILDAPDGNFALAPCRYRFNPFSDTPSFSVVLDVGEGWQSVGHIGVMRQGAGTAAPTGLGIAFMRTEALFSDPCRWDVNGTGAFAQPGDVEVGPEVIDLVDALRASAAYRSTDPPSVVSFGEHVGYEMEIQLPADLNLETCDVDVTDGQHRYIVMSGLYGSLYAQGDGNRWHLFIVDVDGTRVIANVLYYDGTPAADLAAAQAMIESLEFTP